MNKFVAFTAIMAFIQILGYIVDFFSKKSLITYEHTLRTKEEEQRQKNQKDYITYKRTHKHNH